MNGITTFGMLILLVCMAACTDSQEPRVSSDASQEKEAAQSVAETEAIATGAQRSGDSIIFKGICDGSAAVNLGRDTILVAYDELNTLFAFSKSGGMPTARVDLAALLNLKTSDEIDIEAATVSAERIWWLGSHSLDSSGNEAPNRRMLFATNIPSQDLGDLQLVAGPVDLTDILLNSAEVAQVLTATARERPPKKGGISIEGLATSTHGGLMLGFRSPLSGDDGMSRKALLVDISPRGDTFEVQRARLLDLGDRGVRAIVNDGSGYLITAGHAGSGGKFALYAWSGDATPAQQTMSLEGLNAEGLVDMDGHWLVLSDDGTMKREDDEADDGKQRCDRIRQKNRLGEAHPGVFFRARMIPK